MNRIVLTILAFGLQSSCGKSSGSSAGNNTSTTSLKYPQPDLSQVQLSDGAMAFRGVAIKVLQDFPEFSDVSNKFSSSTSNAMSLHSTLREQQFDFQKLSPQGESPTNIDEFVKCKALPSWIRRDESKSLYQTSTEILGTKFFGIDRVFKTVEEAEADEYSRWNRIDHLVIRDGVAYPQGNEFATSADDLVPITNIFECHIRSFYTAEFLAHYFTELLVSSAPAEQNQSVAQALVKIEKEFKQSQSVAQALSRIEKEVGYVRYPYRIEPGKFRSSSQLADWLTHSASMRLLDAKEAKDKACSVTETADLFLAEKMIPSFKAGFLARSGIPNDIFSFLSETAATYINQENTFEYHTLSSRTQYPQIGFLKNTETEKIPINDVRDRVSAPTEHPMPEGIYELHEQIVEETSNYIKNKYGDLLRQTAAGYSAWESQIADFKAKSDRNKRRSENPFYLKETEVVASIGNAATCTVFNYQPEASLASDPALQFNDCFKNNAKEDLVAMCAAPVPGGEAKWRKYSFYYSQPNNSDLYNRTLLDNAELACIGGKFTIFDSSIHIFGELEVVPEQKEWPEAPKSTDPFTTEELVNFLRSAFSADELQSACHGLPL